MRFTRVTLILIAGIITLGFYQLARNFLALVEPQTFQDTEEMMVDTANLLAELVATDIPHNATQTTALRQAFTRAHARRFESKIFDHLKYQVGINVYLTDAQGRVIFDSDGGRREGRNYANQQDVARTLAGRYGARSSREKSDDPSSVLYVAAPVGDPKQPLGVLTVYKPQLDVMPLVHARRRIIYTACGLIGSGILFLIAAVFMWVFHPIGKITAYARAIERGERPAKPNLGIGREVNTLAHALDSMRAALEGRGYVERYVQTLTHEMKSPLAAIRGAAELLREEQMPLATRQRFIGNILAETARTDRLINRLLELSAIESRAHLEQPAEIDFRTIIAGAIDQARPLAEIAGVEIVQQPTTIPLPVRGNAFILRAAVTNLLENAIDFSPRQQAIDITLAATGDCMELTLRDHGPGIPDYARDKVFERFYSLRHHGSGRKGTGLGLTLVREAAELHGGSITLNPAEGGGTLAKLRLPLV